MIVNNSSAASVPSVRRRRKRPKAPTVSFYFALPGAAAFTALVGIPIVLSLYYSFTDKLLLNKTENFVGLSNYVRVMTDSTFLGTFYFTVTLTIVTFVLVNAVGLGIAMLLNRVGRIFFAMRMTFFIPVALSGVIVAFVWSTILTDRGLLNEGLRAVGLGQFTQSWLGTPLGAQASVILVVAWQSLALVVVVYLAGLQTVPTDLLEAARIDGASRRQSFVGVTWPLLAPSLTINSTLLLIGGFKAFDIPVVLTGTGPAGTTATLATEIVRVGFNLNRAGIASAMAIILTLIVIVLTAVALAVLQRREVQA